MNIFYLIIPMIYTLVANSTIAPQEIKNTNSVFRPDFEQLSPLPGLVWAQGGVVENLAELYPYDTNPNVVLIKKLFYRVDQATFLPTRAEYNAASYFTPAVMGEIAALLYTYQKIEPAYKDDKLLEIRLLEIITSATKEKIDQLKKAIGSNAEKDIGIDGAEEIRTHTEKVKRLEKLKTDLDKSIKAYPRLFINAIKATNKNISVFKIIGAFVYNISADKKVLHGYYEGIAQQLDPDSVFVDQSFLKGLGKTNWLSATYKDGEVAKNISADIPYEQLAFSIMKGGTAKSWIAPYMTGYTTAYPPSTEAGGFGYPDCGENSLLNLYRILFAKQHDLSIDISLVEAVSPHSKLLDFFKKSSVPSKNGVLNFSSLLDLRSKEARDSFADMTANIETLCKTSGVYVNRDEYHNRVRPKTFHCEIRSGFNTINHVIKALNGIDFDNLIQELNKHTKDNFSVTKNLNTEGIGTIQIKTLDRGQFIWELQDGHYIFRKAHENSVVMETVNALLRKPEPARDLLALLPLSEDKKALLLDADASYLIFLNRLASDDDILAWSEATYHKGSIKLEGLWNRLQSEDARLRMRDEVFENETISLDKRSQFINMVVKQEPHYAKWLELRGGSSSLTPLQKAASHGNKNIFILLLLHMSTEAINAKDHSGNTVLHHAAAEGHAEMVKLLLPHMSTEAINAKDYCGRTVLHHAAAEGHAEIVELLFPHMSTEAINATDRFGFTALHYAAEKSRAEMVKLLLPHMSTEAINAKDYSGRTVLHHAAAEGHGEIVELLFPHMSTEAISAKDKNGQTALEMAERNKHKTLVKLWRYRMSPQDKAKIDLPPHIQNKIIEREGECTLF